MSSLFMIPHKVSIVIFVPIAPFENKTTTMTTCKTTTTTTATRALFLVSLKSDHPGFPTSKIQGFMGYVYLTL